MNLDNIINKRLYKVTNKKRGYDTPKTKEEITLKNIKKCIRLIKTGDIDPTKRSHGILLGIAHKAGYIDRKTLTILKEV